MADSSANTSWSRADRDGAFVTSLAADTGAPVRTATGPSFFQAIVRCDDGHVVVALQGEFDEASIPILADAVAPLLDIENLSIGFDALELSSIDATGLSYLSGVRTMVEVLGGRAIIEPPPPDLRRALVTFDLDQPVVSGTLVPA